MAKQRSSFAKLQRDKAKKERAAEKRAARLAKNAPVSATVEEEEPTDGQLIPAGGELSAAELMSLVETLHKKRATGAISEEEFEDAKLELLVRLPS